MPRLTSRTCDCGAVVHIAKTGECRRCYMRRWQQERSNARRAGVCACGRPSALSSRAECEQCARARTRNSRAERAAQAASSASCRACRAQPIYSMRTQLCRWCDAISRPMSVTYASCHSRVRSWRGPASAYTCPCGAQATDWAYRGAEASQRLTATVLRGTKHVRLSWSPNPADYDALCRPCHGQRDRSDYGMGYRHDESQRLAKGRQWRAESYARQVSTEEGREAYRARKRAEKARRIARQQSASTTTTTTTTEKEHHHG